MFNVKKVTTEAPFKIFVAYHGVMEIKAVDAYMEGINMFMGKIPLFFKNNIEKNNLFSAKAMVVACAEPNMQWRLWVTVTLFDKNQQKTIKQQFFVDFGSHYN